MYVYIFFGGGLPTPSKSGISRFVGIPLKENVVILLVTGILGGG